MQKLWLGVVAAAVMEAVGVRSRATPVADGSLRSVALRVHHAQRMEDFYATAFGIRFRTVTTGGFESRFGELDGLTIKLVPIRQAPDFEGFPIHQLGIQVDSLERVVNLAVDAGGRRMGDPVVLDGVRQVAIRDPDGNTLELYDGPRRTR